MVTVVVAASCVGAKPQFSGQEGLHRIVRITHDAAHNHDSRLGQCRQRTAADAAADEHIHALLCQQVCHGTMTAAFGVDHLLIPDLAGLDLIDFKLLTMTEVLEHQSLGIRNCNFHRS